MGKRPDLTDDEVVHMVARLRATNGTCSYPDLGEALGMSKNGARWRVATLIHKGRLEVTPGQSGSIRVANPVVTDDTMVVEARFLVDLGTRTVIGVVPHD